MQGQDPQSIAEGRKSAQVVMAELHQPQRLIKLLASRAEERRQRQDSMSIDQTSEYDLGDDESFDTSQLSESMLSQMEAEIRERFREVCGATIRRLRVM